MPSSVKSNEEQEECLAAFRELLGGDSSEYSDTRLKQFLVARNWDINAAKKQLDETLAWRKSNEIDLLPCATRQNGLPLLVAIRGFESFDDGNVQVKPGLSDSVVRISNLMGGDCIHKVDREGHPLLIDRTGYHKAKELCTEVTAEQVTQYQMSCNEFLNRVVMPECSLRAGHTIYQETVIFDCNNLGLAQFHMSALQLLKTVLDIIQHYYPETLNKMFVVNAPTVFVALWKIIKPWLEPRTLEKIHIVSKGSTAETLLQYIAPENLPDFLGGTCTCSHMPGGCVPSVVMGNVPPLEPTPENEKTSSVYNSDLMERAKSDRALRGPVDS